VRLRALSCACILTVVGLVAEAQPPATRSERSGADIYRSACATCHGADGRGVDRSQVGFDTPLPDFTDCSFASPEPDLDWIAVVHGGGPVRAFDRLMPAFGEALTEDEIGRVVSHLRTLCTDASWPRGDLNLPRALFTEKAFPENEALVTTIVPTSSVDAISNEFVYERRLGKRSQFEVVVPFDMSSTTSGSWSRGLGDVAVAFKRVMAHSLERGLIVSAGAELILPTGKETLGLGGGSTIIEPFVAFGQMLPRDGFLHVHGGLERPFKEEAGAGEAFWRIAGGKTFARDRFGRAWSPMIELLAARELESGQRPEWDVVPQMQVTLSTRQHIMMSAGLRIPVNDRESRRKTFVAYFLWDWFDGGLFDGW
jgi:mono/diheme cytochrome c family protein